MAIERNPNDPHGGVPSSDEALRRRADQFDQELQADPELAEGPASGSRIALFAFVLLAILGVVFYGLNSPTTSPNPTPTAQTAPGTSSTDNTAQAPRAPASQTTGAAPSRTATPPATPAPDTNAAPAAPQNNGAPAAPSSK